MYGANYHDTFSGSFTNVGIDDRQQNSTWILSGSSSLYWRIECRECRPGAGIHGDHYRDDQYGYHGPRARRRRDDYSQWRFDQRGLVVTRRMGSAWRPAGAGDFILNRGTAIAPITDSSYGSSTGSIPESFQLNGGVLETSQVLIESGSNPAFTFTMNGGTLLVSNNGTIFNNSGSSTGNEVMCRSAPGASSIPVVDTTCGRPLPRLRPGSDKTRPGTLTLAAANTYSGSAECECRHLARQRLAQRDSLRIGGSRRRPRGGRIRQ